MPKVFVLARRDLATARTLARKGKGKGEKGGKVHTPGIPPRTDVRAVGGSMPCPGSQLSKFGFQLGISVMKAGGASKGRYGCPAGTWSPGGGQGRFAKSKTSVVRAPPGAVATVDKSSGAKEVVRSKPASRSLVPQPS